MEKKKNEILQLVSFKLGEEEFGVDILIVQEIIRMMKITEVPNSPEFIEGMVNLRSRIIPIVDLKKRLNLPIKEYDKETRIIVVDLKSTTVGFIVDEVTEVLRIESNLLEAPPDMVSGINSEYITSVAKLEERLLILLNLNKVISTDEL